MGEVGTSYPFVKLLIESYPDVKILYTVVTETGIVRARELFKNNVVVVRFPFDSYKQLMMLHRLFNPVALFVIETELWPNLLLTSRDRNIPVFLLNARISRYTVSRLRVVKRLARYILDTFTLIFARNSNDARLFTMAGANPSKIVVTGSLKYDTIWRPLKGITRDELGFSENRFVVVFGSVRSKEIGHLMTAVKMVADRAGIVIAPRHMKNVPSIEKMLRSMGISFVKRSEHRPADDSVLILDSIGELWDIYHLADAAFVGGSLADYGGHNILEPAYAGTPVIFGPYIWNVEDYAYPMIKEGVAFRVYDGEELGKTLLHLIENPEKAKNIGQKARKFVCRRSGVSRRILKHIKPYLNLTH